MARTIHRQLYDAIADRGLSYEKVVRDARLKMTGDSLSRKLRGKQALRTREAERIADWIGVQVVAGRAA